MNEVDIDRRFKKLQCDGTHIVNIFNDHEILNTVVNNVLNIPFASESFPQWTQTCWVILVVSHSFSSTNFLIWFSLLTLSSLTHSMETFKNRCALFLTWHLWNNAWEGRIMNSCHRCILHQSWWADRSTDRCWCVYLFMFESDTRVAKKKEKKTVWCVDCLHPDIWLEWWLLARSLLAF